MAVFQSFGYIPVRIGFENIEVREGATILAAIFNEQTTNNELLLGPKKKRKKETRLKYINYFLSLTLVITVKVHLLRDFTTETKRYLAPSKGAVL